jgi:hypothetical protein
MTTRMGIILLFTNMIIRLQVCITTYVFKSRSPAPSASLSCMGCQETQTRSDLIETRPRQGYIISGYVYGRLWNMKSSGARNHSHKELCAFSFHQISRFHSFFLITFGSFLQFSAQNSSYTLLMPLHCLRNSLFLESSHWNCLGFFWKSTHLGHWGVFNLAVSPERKADRRRTLGRGWWQGKHITISPLRFSEAPSSFSTSCYSFQVVWHH